MPSKIVNIEKHREANRKWWKSNYKKKSFIKTNYERFMEKVQFIPECVGLKERWNKHYKSVGNMNKDLLLNRKSLA